MKMRLSKMVMLLALAASAIAGCVVEVTFTPIGNDFSLSGTWTLNGAAPTAAACNAAGIARVGVIFIDGGVKYRFNEFEFPCSQGSFDTRPRLVLADGVYQTQWQAYNASGAEITGMSMTPLPLDTTALVPGAHINLAPVNYVTGNVFNPIGDEVSIAASWTINGVTPTVSLCAAAGIDEVGIAFYDAGIKYTFNELRFPCEQASYDSRPNRILRRGAYTTQWLAYDSAGNELTAMAGTMLPLDVSMSTITHANLAPANYVVDLPESLTINLAWDTNPDPVTMADGTCATAGVDTMTYRIFNTGTGVNIPGQVQLTAPGVACEDMHIVMPIDPGSYTIFFEGYDGGVKKWSVMGGMCDGLDVADGEQAEYNCFGNRTTL